MGLRLWEECASWQGRGLYKGEGARGTLSEGLPSCISRCLGEPVLAGPGQKIREGRVRLVLTGVQHVWGMCVSSYPMINSFLDVDS